MAPPTDAAPVAPFAWYIKIWKGDPVEKGFVVYSEEAMQRELFRNPTVIALYAHPEDAPTLEDAVEMVARITEAVLNHREARRGCPYMKHVREREKVCVRSDVIVMLAMLDAHAVLKQTPGNINESGDVKEDLQDAPGAMKQLRDACERWLAGTECSHPAIIGDDGFEKCVVEYCGRCAVRDALNRPEQVEDAPGGPPHENA